MRQSQNDKNRIKFESGRILMNRGVLLLIRILYLL